MVKNSNDFSKNSQRFGDGWLGTNYQVYCKGIDKDCQKIRKYLVGSLIVFQKDLLGNCLFKGIGEELNKGLNRSLKDFSRIWCGLGKKVQIDF